MPAGMAAEVIADPGGVVVDLLASVEPSLDRTVIAKVVERVGGGRAKRRRLAQALVDQPALLSDGRSPAPRAVGDLLIALREVGAMRISPPVCATCGKALRTLQRRDQDWFCAGCGHRREPCAVCGTVGVTHSRDRDGQPRCKHCPPDEGQDPTEVIIEVVTGVDPTLPREVVIAAVAAAVPRVGRRYQLAWALAQRPELLTGAGAQTQLASVLRLIDALCDAGAQAITRPACPRCDRLIRLHHRIGGQWLCRNCVAKSRAQPCARCGAIREAATRDEQGRPLCPNCLITDTVNQETCIECRRRRPVAVRTPSGPLCENCRPCKTLTCSICGRDAPCLISKATGKPWCRACKQRWSCCAGCGQVRPVRGGTRDEPLCSTCTRPDADFWHSCPHCGQPGRIHAGRCARCTVNRRLDQLLGDETGQIRPELRALHQALAGAQRPSTVESWLNKSAAPAILRELAGLSLTHQALDALPAGKAVEHLRSMLVAIDTLPPRDEHMSRLQRWIDRAITQRVDPDEQHLLRRYGVWHLLRRLRGRTAKTDITHSQALGVRQHIKAAIAVLDWLAAHNLTLATAGQGDLEAWLISEHAIHRRDAGHFIRWANKQKLTSLDALAVRWDGPSQVIDTEARWEHARRLFHDESLKPEDRVAGLLVLLYAQWPATISRLTLKHIQHRDNTVTLSLGREPIVLPEPLAALVLQLVATRRGHAALGDQGTSPWLFPGGQPGRPISAYQLGKRLRQLGLHPGQARSTALFQLATELPAALLARMLGIHITVAVAWQRASSGDWTTYAADVSRRTRS